MSLKKIALVVICSFGSTTLGWSQLEVLIGRCQPLGGFAAKQGQDQAGFAKQGMSFQFSGGAEEGRLAMSYSVFVTTNKFDVGAYRSYLNANNLGSKYTRFDVGKYFGFGFTFGPEYLLEVGDNIIIPFKVHAGFQMMMPPLKFKGYYPDPYSYSGELTYDNMGGNWVYQVLGLNYRLGSGFGYKLDDDITLMCRFDYNNRFLGGQMDYGTGNLRATYPKKFKHLDIGIGLFITL
jgi:hypothetical protein